ncbi:hypothetical protein BEN49_22025 [Hymenobacter coccineus]|uniref:DUF4177 domain-containing protein n=1 Tax=Hymenobacter coccineus TaxID=1908235 RepID=A0A1G1TIK7_9BACT|nr:hypothetical protein BEN49_22025 [Hymenobacter coccineus]
MLAVGAHLAPAQSAPAKTYDFLTVTNIESGTKSLAKMLITPAFQGKTEVQLEDLGSLSVEKNLAKIARNTEVINRQLTELTAAGWEFVQAYPFAFSPDLPTTRYLFRKARN